MTINGVRAFHREFYIQLENRISSSKLYRCGKNKNLAGWSYPDFPLEREMIFTSF